MQAHRVQLTENQRKVIKDKYLKDSPTPEAWLETISGNIALGEILHHPRFNAAEFFKGINVRILEEDIYGQKARSYLLHHQLQESRARNENFRIFMDKLYMYAQRPEFKQAYEAAQERFYTLMAEFKFLPNSPTLMNAGRALQQLSACYVLPVEDSMDSIFTTVKNMAMVHQSGGGTGFCFSHLRPKNDEVRSTKGVASGPVSFMSIFDKATDIVKQGGTRRGANMGILRYDHPDIKQFIHCKEQQGFLENFNISVTVDKAFMEKALKGEDYDLVNPHHGNPAGKLNAKEVFDDMVKNAWKTGDPGIIFIDRINESDANPTPKLGQIESTNPCGEQPLLPYEPCNLGSINLAKFVDDGEIDYEGLRDTIFAAVHMLDNVIDVNNYPIPEIELLAKGNRRIGLGVMGWAEMLAQLGIAYDSDQALQLAEKVMKFVNDKTLEASVALAKVRGVFPNYKDCIYDKRGKFFRGRDVQPRHSARTTIAPTGTIAITAGLQGSGIEPFFAIAYVRYNAAGIDALKENRTPAEKDTFFEVNPLFQVVAKEHDYFGMPEKELWVKIEKNHKSVRGIPEIPAAIQRAFPTAHDLGPLDHVKMQCAFQKYTDNAVSKTVNLRNDATEADVREVYLQAYKLGAKGITIYRDGSKTFQILNTSEKGKKEDGNEAQAEKPKRQSSSYGEMSAYYEINTGYGPLHCHINYDEFGPTRMFLNISPMGTEISGMTGALAILISKYMQEGGDPSKLLKHLNSVKGDRPYGLGNKRVDSIPHAIAKVLRDHLIKTGKLTVPQQVLQLNGSIGEQTVFSGTGNVGTPVQKVEHHEGHGHAANEKMYCSKCYSPNVAMMAGCSEPVCLDCGYSKCG